MQDKTIITTSKVGQRLNNLGDGERVSYLMFNNKKIRLVAQITIGRQPDNDIIIDNKLASRRHALIQKIKDDYYLRDEGSTNGTFLNGNRIPAGSYVKLEAGDRITIGNANLVIS
ncbi:MAG TPA: FHA domain-containing protein [Candidatus Treponema faecavium]|nr:FHA domain-containing protein [Candidatus Treponema faecavium]